MKKKIIKSIKKIRKNVAKYLSTNRLFLTYIIFGLIMTVLLRNFTIGNTFDYKPFICDLAFLIIIGSFGYFFKPKKQFNYFFIWIFIIGFMCVVNSIYYTFYTSFASFSLLAELGLVGDVADSLTEKFKLVDFIYVIFPVLFYFLHKGLKKGTYYNFVGKVEKAKKMFVSTGLVGIVVLSFTLVNITGTDASRLVKQWNREYLVQRFGIILYQGNDLVQSLTPKISSLFGYDEAAKRFKDFYTKKEATEFHKDNKYTNILEDMNVIFVHLESQQNILVDMKINDQEITPTLNMLTKEGMYFDHFYPQISVGTSSDSEFTLNTSLMPANSGTVFVSYANREYISIPKLLTEKGYYTFSSHGNGASMWNRSVMHPNLGYQEMFFKDSFDVTDENSCGLGLSDQAFWTQLRPKLEKIEDEHEKYMGTLMELSNHSPFGATENNPELYETYGKLNLKNTYVDKDGKIQTDDYLDDTKFGNYLISAYYADMALGEFIEYVKESEYYNNTVFVFYGDHEAKLGQDEFNRYYNYDVTTGKMRDSDDPLYVEYDSISYSLDTNTPLIIWTKNEEVNKKLKGVNHNVMGMYDILPTIGNMMGFESKYALGHDIYDIGENNVVIFPNGNFITNKIYYNNSSGNYRIINSNNGTVDLDVNYIENLKKYAEERLEVSNDIIVYDLIHKEGNKGAVDENKIEEEIKNG